jgi:hypothetical protein
VYSKIFTIVLIALLILNILSGIGVTQAETHGGVTKSSSSEQTGSFNPTSMKMAWADQDSNGIEGSLNGEIAEKIAKGSAQDYVNVIVMLKAAPTTLETDNFAPSGGYLTTPLCTKALYGFGGTITYNGLVEFVQRCPDVLLVEKEASGEVSVAYAAQQVGARTYVWNTLGPLESQ